MCVCRYYCCCYCCRCYIFVAVGVVLSVVIILLFLHQYHYRHHHYHHRHHYQHHHYYHHLLLLPLLVFSVNVLQYFRLRKKQIGRHRCRAIADSRFFVRIKYRLVQMYYHSYCCIDRFSFFAFGTSCFE